jgi:hypothetical protein
MSKTIKHWDAIMLAHKRKWVAMRDASIERLVAADESDDITIIVDTIAVAHIAAALEWCGEIPKESGSNEEIGRLVDAWNSYDRDRPKKLRAALDDFTVVHATKAFEISGLPLKL